MTIKIGLSIDPSMPRFLELAREAERIGVDSVWVAEFWASDAFTPLAAIAAVDGSFDEKLADLEALIALAAAAGEQLANTPPTTPTTTGGSTT